MASLRRLPDSRYWIACFTGPDGRRTQRSTKETDRKRALQIADRFQEAARSARLGFLAERQARKVIGDIYEISNREKLVDETIKGFFQRWLASKKSEIGHNSFKRYAGIVTQFLAWLGPRGEIGLQHLTSRELVHFRDFLASKHAPTTVNLAVDCLASALGKAFEDGLVDVNEAGRVPRLDAQPVQERRAFTDGELRAILAACDPEWRGMTLVGAYTGMRLGDIAGLQWESVDLQSQELHFRMKKTDRNITIPIAQPLYRHFMSIADDTTASAVFPRAYALSQRQTSVLSKQFHKVLAKAGLVTPRSHQSTGKGRDAKRAGGIGFHCLRHTATSLLKRAGASNAVAMEIIGHATESVSQMYTHIDVATLRAAIDKLPDIT